MTNTTSQRCHRSENCKTLYTKLYLIMYQSKLFIGFLFVILFVYLPFSCILIQFIPYEKKFELLGLPKVPNRSTQLITIIHK